MDLRFLQGGFCKRGSCSEWATGLSLDVNKALKWGQEAWIWGFYKLHSFEKRHVKSGQVGFPLLLNKALAGVKKHGLDVCTRWTLWGHVQSDPVGLPLLLNIYCNFTNTEVGTRSLEMLISMLYVVWRNHHTSWGTFWKNLGHEKCGCLKISRFTKSCGFVPTPRRLGGNGCYALGRWEAPAPVYKQPIGAA